MKRFERWIVVAALVGCSGDDTLGTTDKVDGDADTDVDSDTDVDTDTDTDTDTGTVEDSLRAQIDYERFEDGTSTCHRAYELDGVPYTGACRDCLFAFDVTSTETSATGEDCGWIDPRRTFTSSYPWQTEIKLAFAETYEQPYYYGPWTGGTTGGATVEDAVLFGYVLDWSAYDGPVYPDPLWSLAGYAGATWLPDVSWDGTNLALTSSLSYDYYVWSHYLDFCTNYTWFYQPVADFAGGEPAEGDVPCDGQLFDVWEFTVEAGQVVQIRLDNAAGAAPEDVILPSLTLTDEAGCQIGWGSGSFDCAVEVPGWDYYPYYPLTGTGTGGAPPPTTGTLPPPYASNLCPSLELTAPAAATYRVVVSGWGYTCTGGAPAPYVLSGNADGAPLVFSLLAGDQPYIEGTIPMEVSTVFDGTVVYTP